MIEIESHYFKTTVLIFDFRRESSMDTKTIGKNMGKQDLHTVQNIPSQVAH